MTKSGIREEAEGFSIFLVIMSDGKPSVLTEQAAVYSYHEGQKWLQELFQKFKTIHGKKTQLYKKCS